MYVILLSGESGKRLWPLTNDTRSRQFIKIMKRPDGSYESMIQRVYRQIKQVDPEADIVAATSKSQMSELRNQLGNEIELTIEPCRKGTFLSIAQAVAFLHDVKGVDPEEAVVVCPIDTFVEDKYYNSLGNMYEAAKNEEGNIILIGIEPTYPSEKYGYIIPKTEDGEHYYFGFAEKPDKEQAEQYISIGGLWNSGVYSFKLKYILDAARRILGTNEYEQIHSNYETWNTSSFDREVAEKEKRIEVLRYLGYWRDIGTWNTLTETMSDVIIGKGLMDESCYQTHLVNELDIPILAMGLKNIVVAASPSGILVSEKLQSSEINRYVGKLDNEIRYAEKSWGEFRILEVDQNGLTAQINMKAGSAMSYHMHQNRSEIWTIAYGTGHVLIDGEDRAVSSGSIVEIKAGSKHMIRADSEMKIIEVQIGSDLSVHDKIKFDRTE